VIQPGKVMIQKQIGGNVVLVIVVAVMCIVMLYVITYIFRQHNNTSLKTISQKWSEQREIMMHEMYHLVV
jgi:uncharacterized membrane protein (DUF485 family)